ncbi:MAG: dTDP-4-dehydrorhamnose 3,5-epimerase [Gemmatimonadales bacterium]|nr:dTDP-4-dehydrorhamnose 3,5-epimerase [Gemmatimonadales bacterium]
MNVFSTEIPGVLRFEPPVHGDARGFFMETWHRARYRGAGIVEEFVQDNVALSRRGVLRGLHFQQPNPQGKLVSALRGEVFDVAVDVRRGSATFGKWVGACLSETNRHQLYVPPGFAHGYLVTSDEALFAYKCTANYEPASERTVRWDDPVIGIDWPNRAPTLSARDAAAPLLGDITALLPAYR